MRPNPPTIAGRTRALILLATAFLIGTSTSNALIIASYNATLDARFTTNIPANGSSPTLNPNFRYAALDFSGVGWRNDDPRFACTLISPQHFLTAAHVKPANNSTLSFLSNNGTLHSYTVASTTPLYFSTGTSSDLVVGTLTTPVSPELRHYPILDLATLGNSPNLTPGNLTSQSTNPYLNLPLIVYGQHAHVGTNTLVYIGHFAFNNPTTPDSLFALMLRDNGTPTNAQCETGDSGSPTFVLVNNRLALLAVHSAVDNLSNPTVTFDTPAFPYASQIKPILAQLSQPYPIAPDPLTLTPDQLLLYALTTTHDPANSATNTGTLTHLPTATITNNTLRLTLTPTRQNLLYEIQQSTDLQTWTTISTLTANQITGNSTTISSPNNTTTTPQQFLRLKITPTSQ